ncbi:glycoside hydrolase 5 family protein [Flavobacterium silvaticum]|uniref:mannan endo-1,4-beta-mannosidase n=1 Tax=Flavobacterium silvaticum TaxID=1852020 RepID=A0A972JEZ4_9FLAO|nr:cellulase family glycosylhydrolase [Flavobacterium silvaticum]NMH27419.1 cellulase family glycosylhydrolase [Flavobacterium silvaticum]
MKKSICMLLLGCLSASAQNFVTVKGTEFLRDGKAYHYIGANYWYGALLASEKYGDRKRLLRELDQLKANGMDNLRVLVGADGGSYDYTVPYALQPKQGQYDAAVLDGLDYLLSEMKKRDMVAVLYLTNNWEWSGGMSQYLEWNGYGEIPNPNLKPENTWPKFMDYVSQFHSCGACKEALEKHIRYVIGRTNAYTKTKYTEDPTIMAWQVANEPRIFKVENEKAFTNWLDETVNLIDSLDKNHLICTGSEGKAGSNDDIAAFERTHQNPKIDYLTMHIWPKNWSWYDYKNEKGTLPTAIAKATDYIEQHISAAQKLNRPIVIEEFGLPRRDESLLPTSDVSSRNAFYEVFFDRLSKSIKDKQPLQAVNFWGYGGEGRAVHENGKWEKGEAFTADPPQEPQGLNAVFSTDETTLQLIKKYNRNIRKL